MQQHLLRPTQERHAMNAFVPKLTTTDWNEEWKRLQLLRNRADDANYWNKRAASYQVHDTPDPYTLRFMDLLGVRPGESIFDMGCGTGSLSIPFAQSGHRVMAADFSEAMLDIVRARTAKYALTSVRTYKMSWSDNWQEQGICPHCADIALASRSIATADLRDALLRLSDVANRRVGITIATGSSPRTDERVLAAVGLDRMRGHDYLYAFQILTAEGILPELAYIKSEREDVFTSKEAAYVDLYRMILHATSWFARSDELERAKTLLREWLEENLVENTTGSALKDASEKNCSVRLSHPRVITWAFLGWNV